MQFLMSRLQASAISWSSFSAWRNSREPAEQVRSRHLLELDGRDHAQDLIPLLNHNLVIGVASAGFATSLGIAIPDLLWRGALDSLAGRQLKWIYPVSAHDDEFLKRATLASTLVIEALQPASMRRLLAAIDDQLYQTNDDPPRSLAARNLLQRLALVAALIENFQPDIREIPLLVMQAESKVRSANDDLKTELEQIYQRVRDEFAALAFLYEMRIHAGLAHHPNVAKVAAAAAELGLAKENWHHPDYLRLLNLVTNSVLQIKRHFENACSTRGRYT